MTNSKNLIGQNVPADEITEEPCEISEGCGSALTKRGLAALAVYLTLALSGLTQASAQEADAAAGAVGEGGSDGAGSVGHADWAAGWTGIADWDEAADLDAEVRKAMIEERSAEIRKIFIGHTKASELRRTEERRMEKNAEWFISAFGRLDYDRDYVQSFWSRPRDEDFWDRQRSKD